jgi:hypothetical protein
MDRPAEFNKSVLLGGAGGEHIYTDLRYFPLVITWWEGVATEELITAYYTWRMPLQKYAAANKTKVVAIHELTNVGAPNATTRKLTSDYASKDDSDPGFLWNVNVGMNALVRGTITAMNWLTGGKIPMTFVAGMTEGLDLALSRLSAAGLNPPDLDPKTYKFPLPNK